MWPSDSYLVGHKIVSIICVDHFYRPIIQRFGGNDICACQIGYSLEYYQDSSCRRRVTSMGGYGDHCML